MSSARDIQLEQAAAGDGEAFRAVIAAHLGTLRVLCRRLAPTEADAQDLLRSSVRPLTGPSGEALCRPDQAQNVPEVARLDRNRGLAGPEMAENGLRLNGGVQRAVSAVG